MLTAVTFLTAAACQKEADNLVDLPSPGVGEQPELHPAQSTLPPQFSETTIANTLTQATHMVVAPDGRLFVCEQPGVVRLVVNDQLQSTPFATIDPATIEGGGSRGLMGIALSPNFATDRYLYLAYTRKSPLNNRIVRIRASATNANVAEANAQGFVTIHNAFELSPQGGSQAHNSMAMRFSGGLLYVSTGDNQLQGMVQTQTHSVGKVLRMNADLTPAAGNPYAGDANPYKARLWAKGLRNPWTMAVNSAGLLYVSDVGSFEGMNGTPNNGGVPVEEINIIPTGPRTVELDYGWPSLEGGGANIIHTYPQAPTTDEEGSDCAVVGGTFYEPNTTAFPSSPKFPPEYNGAYFFGDHCSKKIKYLPAAQQAPQTLSGNPPAASARQPLEFASETIRGMLALEASPTGAFYYLTRGHIQPRNPNEKSSLVKITYVGMPIPETCALTSPAEGARFTSPASFTMNVTAADSTGGGIQRVEFFSTNTNIPGAPQQEIGEDTSAPYSLDLTGLGKNAYRLVARCTNAQGGFKDSDPVTVTVDGPTAVIDNPVGSLTYNAGDTINFSGTGVDSEGNSIPPSRFTWVIALGHGVGAGAHYHELPDINGVASGSYVVARDDETDPNVFQRITLIVQDSAGIYHSVFRDIFPNKTDATVATSPAGLIVKVDGIDRVGGVPFVSVVGMERELSAPLTQVHNGRLYRFTGWSNGGAANQDWIVPNGNPTITASYQDLGATNGDIGAVAAAGSFTGNVSSITVRGSGADVWSTADEFHFLHFPWTGDGILTARVVSLQNTNGFAKAGVMMRDGTAANARNFFMFVTPVSSNGFRFQRRTTAGAITDRDFTTSTNAFPNNWVRIQRQGNVFTSYHSDDGANWTKLGGDYNFALPSTLRIGLAVTSHADGTVASGMFDNVSITTLAPTLPGAPTNLVCTAGNNQCACTWTAPTTGAASYNLKRSTTSGSGHAPVVSNHPSTSYTDTSALNGPTYYYVVSANSAAGEGPNSSQALPCTPAAPQPPNPPTNLMVIGGAGQATLSWTDNASNEQGTKIERKLQGDPDTSFMEVATVGANVVDYIDTPLAANTYSWRVRAYNAAGNSTYAGPASATVTAPPTGPAPPSNLAVATSGSTVVNLTWSDNSTNEAGFRIERKTGTGTFGNLKTVAANSVSTTDNTATAGNTYSYRVIATGTPESAASNEAVAVFANPVADAYVREGTNAGINYGTETFIKIKLNTTVNNNRRGYVRFSLTGVAPNVTSAKLRLYGVAVTNTKQIGVHAVSNTTWGETSITFGNAPPMTSPAIQTRPITTTAAYVEWDVTSYIQQQRAVNASAVSLGLLTTSSFPDTETNINSRENAANKPILIIGSRP